MAHGAPDNYEVKPTNITNTLQDDAELAVRLGAVSSIDRLGNVIWFDNFSNGSNSWILSGDGLGNDASVSSARYKHGGFSLKLTGGRDDDLQSTCYVFLTYPEPSKNGHRIQYKF